MLTLGIETSCDETAASLVENGRILVSCVSSSVHLHSRYGGVVPEIASRFHVEYIFSVVEKAFKDARRRVKDIGLVAVTEEPGLPGSLIIGIAFAKALSFAGKIPLIKVNHLEAHILACFFKENNEYAWSDIFPFIGVVVSGGHTSIYVSRGIKDFSLIGRTKDDAAGEAFDKVAKLLGLGYPGGAIVEKTAQQSENKEDIGFPRALLKERDDLDFSFSGIKTAVMRYWQSSQKTEKDKARVSYSFQEAVIDVIDEKIARAIRLTGIGKLAVGGGVINNEELRQRLMDRCKRENVELYMPPKRYCSDNAAMTAVLGEALFFENRERG